MIRKTIKQPTNQPANQRGLAIITVVLIVALMMTLLAFLVEQQHLLIRRISNQNVAEKGYQYSLGVSAWAQQVLHEDKNREIDHLYEDWAKFGKPPEVEDEDGYQEFSLDPSLQPSDDELATIDFGNEAELEFEIIDLQSRFNLNNLSNPNPKFLNDQKTIFLNLLEQIEIEQIDSRLELYDALKDWMDSNDTYSGYGKESGHYRSKESPYYAADQKLVSLAELRFVEGYTVEIIAALRPYVTVLPVDAAKLNMNTASAVVLSSLSSVPVVNIGSVEAFLAVRESDAFLGFQAADMVHLETAIIGASPVGRQPVQNMLQTNSQFFQVNSQVRVGDYTYCMKTVLLRENASPDSSSTPRVTAINRQHDTYSLCQELNNNTLAEE